MLWDGIVLVLGLRALPSGRKTWFVHRRVANGFVKRTLSATDTMSIEDARCAARALIEEAKGGDGAVAVTLILGVVRRARWTPIGIRTLWSLLQNSRGERQFA